VLTPDKQEAILLDHQLGHRTSMTARFASNTVTILGTGPQLDVTVVDELEPLVKSYLHEKPKKTTQVS
jgi:hypothetical protein